jgi:hypothetical protein
MQVVSELHAVSQAEFLTSQFSFEPLEQEHNANASVKVRIKLFISIFYCFAGTENFEISTYGLTVRRSASELRPSIIGCGERNCTSTRVMSLPWL